MFSIKKTLIVWPVLPKCVQTMDFEVLEGVAELLCLEYGFLKPTALIKDRESSTGAKLPYLSC